MIFVMRSLNSQFTQDSFQLAKGQHRVKFFLYYGNVVKYRNWKSHINGLYFLRYTLSNATVISINAMMTIHNFAICILLSHFDIFYTKIIWLEQKFLYFFEDHRLVLYYPNAFQIVL